MTNSPQLCLGTVQFGLPYGITNQSGQVPEEEVRRILNLAAASGIELLDTAQAYGTAETVLGSCWPRNAPRRMISKLPAKAPPESWETNLFTSLKRLRVEKLDGYLLHRASDLLAPNGEDLLKWLESVRERGLIERIGISIYEADELEGLPLDRLQLVQLPLSIYNQGLIRNGVVNKLNDLGIAVHMRSVLLQGLILQAPEHWPDHISHAFRDHHAQWLETLHKDGVSPLAGALGFARSCKGVEAVLVGVVTIQELAQIVKAWRQIDISSTNTLFDWGWENSMDLDPRHWPAQ